MGVDRDQSPRDGRAASAWDHTLVRSYLKHSETNLYTDCLSFAEKVHGSTEKGRYRHDELQCRERSQHSGPCFVFVPLHSRFGWLTKKALSDGFAGLSSQTRKGQTHPQRRSLISSLGSQQKKEGPLRKASTPLINNHTHTLSQIPHKTHAEPKTSPRPITTRPSSLLLAPFPRT